MKIRYINTPSDDHLLTPDTYRRYSVHIITYFCMFFSVASFLIGKVLFNQGYEFWATIGNIRSHNVEELSKIMVSLFYTKCAIAGIPSFAFAYFLTNKLTKPISRETHLEGNFIDESVDVIDNLRADFAQKTQGKKIALLRKGDVDYNKSPNGNLKLKQDLFLPNEILELSAVVRGEAGSGKSVLLDRFIKEAIDSNNKVILHSIKGDEIEKLGGYARLYVIEPWNDRRGYALDFLNMVVNKDKQIQDAKIRTLVDSFSVAIPGKADFFEKGSTAVIEALMRCVVESNKDKDGKVTTDLGAIVDLWNSFNVKEVNLNVDPTDLAQAKKELSENDDQLQKIKDFLIIWNPSATIYVDPQNAKTSLCVLASCIDLIRKFELLSGFLKKNIAQEKVLDIQKWLNTPPEKDRPVILLVNSNQFANVANCYISAFINLVVNEVIEESYKAPWQLHFILDEFPQLTAIDIGKFLKLPDVGRGKNIRVIIALQRTSQIKQAFNMDGESFVSAFQNKYWCRMATDDLPIIEKELGKRDVSEVASTANYTGQGKSLNTKTTKKKIDVINVNHTQKYLKPVSIQPANKNAKSIFCGVRVLFNFSNISRVAIILMPPVTFTKKIRKAKPKSTASGNLINLKEDEAEDENKKDEKVISTQIVQEINTVNNHIEEEKEDESVAVAIAVEHLAGAIGGEVAVAMMHLTELLENFEDKSLNNNIVEVIEEVKEVSSSDVSKKIEELKNKTRKNKNKNEDLSI